MQLPDLILRSGFADDTKFVEACYALFKVDFLDSLPDFRGKKMGLKTLPKRDGKEATFYHMTTVGKDEATRTLEYDRSERIRWVRPILENEGSSQLRVWTERMRGDNRIHLWLHQQDYVIVISERNGYYVPWTAFYINYTNYRDKIEKRWQRNK